MENIFGDVTITFVGEVSEKEMLLELEVAALQKQINELKSLNKDLQVFKREASSELAHKKSRCAKLVRENMDLKENLNEAISNIDEMSEALATATIENWELRDQLEVLANDNFIMQEELKAADHYKQAAEKWDVKLRTEISHMNKNLDLIGDKVCLISNTIPTLLATKDHRCTRIHLESISKLCNEIFSMVQ